MVRLQEWELYVGVSALQNLVQKEEKNDQLQSEMMSVTY